MKKFRIVEHTADVGIEAYGEDLNELFANAAYGMFSIICSPDKIREKKSVQIDISAPGLEDLLHSWLDELLYREDAEGMVFGRFEVSIEDKYRLSGKVFGEELDAERHHPGTEIKAVTYHQLKIQGPEQKSKIPEERAYRARVLFDV